MVHQGSHQQPSGAMDTDLCQMSACQGSHSVTENGKDSQVSLVERVMQEDFRWGLSSMGDMCESWGKELQQGATDMDYYD